MLQNIDIPLSTLDSYSFCELVCMVIAKYYDGMVQKPLLQNVVDTISLIRFYYIRVNTDNDDDKTNFLHRLKSLYEPIIDYDTLDMDNLTSNNTILPPPPNPISSFQYSYLSKENEDNNKYP